MKRSRIAEFCTQIKVTVAEVASTAIFIVVVISIAVHEILRLLK